MPKLRAGEAFIEFLHEDTADERLVTSRAEKVRLETVTVWREGPDGKPVLARQARFCLPDGVPEELKALVTGHVYGLLMHLDPPVCDGDGCPQGGLRHEDLMGMQTLQMIVGIFGPISFVQFGPSPEEQPPEQLSEEDLRRGLEGIDLGHPPGGIPGTER